MKASQDKQKERKPACPYCTRDISFDANECPWCGTSYGLQTMELVRSVFKVGGAPPRKNRRKEDRIPKKFRIAYTTPKALIDSYLSNISLGGLYIRTNNPLDQGTRLTLKIFLPDGEKELEVHCEVAWARSEEKVTPNETLPQGMGLKFLNLSPEGKERIHRILHQTKPNC